MIKNTEINRRLKISKTSKLRNMLKRFFLNKTLSLFSLSEQIRYLNNFHKYPRYDIWNKHLTLKDYLHHKTKASNYAKKLLLNKERYTISTTCKHCKHVFNHRISSNTLNPTRLKQFCSLKCYVDSPYYIFKRSDIQRKNANKWADKRRGQTNIEYYGKEKANLISKKISRAAIKSLKNYYKTHSSSRKNKTLEEIMGVERAKEAKKKLSIAFSGKNNPSYGIPRYPKLKYIEELGHSIRSNWEKEVFLKFKKNKISYDYEPEAFALSNSTTYTPDARLKDSNIFIEIKGPIFDWQIEKMKLFKKEYPTFKLIAITNNRRHNFEKLSFCDKIISYNSFITDTEVNI